MNIDVLREFVRQALEESWTDFAKATSHIDYNVGLEDPFFAGKRNKSPVRALKGAKDVKRAFNKHADREFFKNLVKVHWFNPRSDPPEAARRFLTMSRKNEISTVAYNPGAEMKPPSMSYYVGVQVDGWVTLAANDSDYIVSGYHGAHSPVKTHTSSGTPKRPTSFSTDHAEQYILDKASFQSGNTMQSELIIDNWKPLRWVIRPDMNITGDSVLGGIIHEFGMPIVDLHGQVVSLD